MASSLCRVAVGAIVFAVAAGFLAGCGALPTVAVPGRAVDGAGASAPLTHDFPSIASAKWRDGSSPDPQAVREVRPGLDKDQVRRLLSWPHFSEGIFGVREWNYIFHLGDGTAPRRTCQFMVRFDERMRVADAYWQDPGCAALVRPRARLDVQALPASAALSAGDFRVSIGTDLLFDDGVVLSRDGRRLLRQLAAEIRQNFATVSAVRVKGHTDRTVPPDRSDALSNAFADAVRAALRAEGVAPASFDAVAAGAREPRVDCARARDAGLQACLRPNRRVDIDIQGER